MERFIGVVGLGCWGKNILRNFYELGVIHTACDFSQEVIEERRKNYPDIIYTTDFNELLNNPKIKAIAIATPAITHYELAKKAFLSGKDVFIEKPMTTSVREGEELVKLAKEKNRILMVGHILQYHPGVVKLKELISQGLIGDILYIYSHRVNVGKIRTDENVWWSLAPHDISLTLMLTEAEPKKINYQGASFITKGIDDIALASIEFNNGIKGHIFVSWWHPYKEQKLVVIGSRGMLVFDDITEEKLFLYPHKVDWNGNIPVARKEDVEVIPIEKKEPLKEELLHFIECVRERKTPKTDGYEGLKVIKVLEKVTSDG